MELFTRLRLEALRDIMLEKFPMRGWYIIAWPEGGVGGCICKEGRYLFETNPSHYPDMLHAHHDTFVYTAFPMAYRVLVTFDFSL